MYMQAAVPWVSPLVGGETCNDVILVAPAVPGGHAMLGQEPLHATSQLKIATSNVNLKLSACRWHTTADVACMTDAGSRDACSGRDRNCIAGALIRMKVHNTNLFVLKEWGVRCDALPRRRGGLCFQKTALFKSMGLQVHRFRLTPEHSGFPPPNNFKRSF